MLVQGHSHREIGRTLHVSPMTVSKISKTDEFRAVIRNVQTRIAENLSAVAESVIAGAIADPYLGYRLLKHFGVIPDSGAGFLGSLKNISRTAEENREARAIRHIAGAMARRHRQSESEEPVVSKEVLSPN
jgi:hypothetical protein